jgi:hypothetical protein
MPGFGGWELGFAAACGIVLCLTIPLVILTAYVLRRNKS